jgi:HSP20 family molecular chaperone IbpA
MDTQYREKNNPDNTGPQGTIEPLTTLIDEGKFLRILTELPGVNEETIRFDIEKTTVTIAASDAGKEVKKTIVLPCEGSFCMKQFSEGVLKLTLEKISS